MGYVGYRNLLVWQRSRRLAVDIYRITAGGTIARDWSLRDQMRRAAISVASNIAEGTERGSSADTTRFLWFAKGSLAELATQADIATAIGALDESVGRAVQLECYELGAMLKALIKQKRGAERREEIPSHLQRPPSHL